MIDEQSQEQEMGVDAQKGQPQKGRKKGKKGAGREGARKRKRKGGGRKKAAFSGLSNSDSEGSLQLGCQ